MTFWQIWIFFNTGQHCNSCDDLFYVDGSCCNCCFWRCLQHCYWLILLFVIFVIIHQLFYRYSDVWFSTFVKTFRLWPPWSSLSSGPWPAHSLNKIVILLQKCLRTLSLTGFIEELKFEVVILIRHDICKTFTRTQFCERKITQKMRKFYKTDIWIFHIMLQYHTICRNLTRNFTHFV